MVVEVNDGEWLALAFHQQHGKMVKVARADHRHGRGVDRAFGHARARLLHRRRSAPQAQRRREVAHRQCLDGRPWRRDAQRRLRCQRIVQVEQAQMHSGRCRVGSMAAGIIRIPDQVVHDRVAGTLLSRIGLCRIGRSGIRPASGSRRKG
jgi:hypothetical protein